MSTVGWLLRSEQAYCLQLCEKETLDFGIAYYNARFREHPEANQFREVWIEDVARIDDAFTQAEEWFRGRGLVCHRWAPAGGAASDELSSFLLGQGFTRRAFAALALAKWADLHPPSDVRVLPARAMRAAFAATLVHFDASRLSVDHNLYRDAYLERLNDAPLEMMIAVIDKTPAGRCALFQTGDIARVMDLTVLPAFLDRGVAEALLANVLAFAKRMAMRNVCTMTPLNDPVRLEWLEQAGFVRDGEIVEFDRA